MRSKIMPTTYLLALLLLSVGLHFVFPIKNIIHSPYNYLGIIFIVFGGTLNIWADRVFKKSNTTVKPHETPSSLEVTGPFCISRHPMYLGMCAILLGEAIILGSIITFSIPILFIILMEVIFIPYEDENLEEAFGEEYINYRKKVRRWI
ncbi:methyltransferase family protein [Acidobacteriota bacterium]